ncbi:DUF6163 family protein [Amorphus sp. 3PC139-8]|uniref:DUF6163 family protein n=1 Tax=Amorphus sp. 3PC139-8 TaxID=2735676 RepID=UPI00345CDDBE
MIDIEALKLEPSKLAWRTVMTVFLRTLAVLWLVAGVAAWARIIGVLQFGDLWFWQLQTEVQIAAVYFAVLNLVAGVGLWLTVSWGTVLWLLAATSQIIVHTAMADIFGGSILMVIGNVLTILAFVVLVIMIEREEAQ